MIRMWRALLCAIGSVLVVSCGGDNLIPVEGTVTYDGKSLPHGSIAFHPDASKGNKAAHAAGGEISDGQFRLKTLDRYGAPPGWYKVTVISTAPTDPEKYEVPKSLIPEKYTRVDTTPITLEVKTGGSYTIELKRN